MILTENGVLKLMQRIKSFIASQLNTKAASVHTHTKSDITDLPNGYVVDSTLDGTSSNAVSNSAVSNALTSVLPVGSYIQFAGSQAPAGFLVCNGGEISRTTYSALFAVIGTTYGSGDGSTTFNLPNLTDRFLQGSTTSGTVRDAGLPNLRGIADGSIDTFDAKSTKNGVFSDSVYRTKIDIENLIDGSDDWEYILDFNASKSNSIYGNSSTVQPPALTCLICIKY